MKSLIEIDPNKLLHSAQLDLANKITMARSKLVNEMIEENIPKWKIYLLKKSKLFARFFGIFTILEPQPKFESDILHEKLILCTGSKTNPKRIAEKPFRIQDRRKMEGLL